MATLRDPSAPTAETKRSFAPKLAAIYLVGSIVFAYLADWSLSNANLPQEISSEVQVYLMVAFIVITALLIYLIAGVYARRLAKVHDERMRSNMTIAHRLALAIEMRDQYASGHNHRLGRFCQILGSELGLSEQAAEQLYHAAALHDVGKIGIPDEVLNKPGALSPAEIELIRKHVEYGAALLSNSDDPLMQLAHTIVLTHHEAWDGTGYPNGLKGEAIPLAGRIAAVADVFDALNSKRPYKEAWALDDVLKEIRRLKGTRFDPRVVDALERRLNDFQAVESDNTPPPWQVLQTQLSS